MKIISGKEFEKETKEGLIIVDFFATWCGPCKMMAVVLEEIQEEHPDFKIVKIDVDKDEALARKFGIMSIPTIIIMQNGEMMEKHVGFMQKDDLVDLVNSYLQ